MFWSYRFEDLRLPDDKDLVMLHVLTCGGAPHMAWLRQRYGDAGIRRWIVKKQGKGLSIAQMAPWVAASRARRWRASNPGSLIWEQR